MQTIYNFEKVYIMIRIIIVLVITFLLLSCATTYRSSKGSYTGGYYEDKISNNEYIVGCSANGYTSSERAFDIALIRAAEITLQQGFEYFLVFDSDASINEYVIYSGYAMITSYKPNVKLLGILLKNEPLQYEKYYRADSTLISLCNKYQLDNSIIKGEYQPNPDLININIESELYWNKQTAETVFYYNNEPADEFEVKVGEYKYWENPVGNNEDFIKIINEIIEDNNLPISSVRIYDDPSIIHKEKNIYLDKTYPKSVGFVALFYEKPSIDFGVIWEPYKLQSGELVIRDIVLNSVASKNQFKFGDKILKVNKEDVFTAKDFYDELSYWLNDDPIEIVVIRDGNKVILNVDLDCG